MSEICPYCHAPVQDNTSKCTYCLKPIDRCILCHAPIVPESTVCSLCGGFPLPEPRLNMNVWVEGGVYLDEYGVIMVHLSNTGNNPTSVSIHIAADKGIDPIKFDDNIESLHPGMGVERSYKFKITEITRITFKDITATYIHRDGGKDTLKLQPFTFESYGRPVVNIDFNKKEVDLKLGEVNKIYFNVLNNGTEKVGKMNIFINISPSIEVTNKELIVTDIDIGDMRTGFFELKPLFTGKYLCEYAATYTGDLNKPVSSNIFQHPSVNILLIVNDTRNLESVSDVKPSRKRKKDSEVVKNGT